MPLDAVLKAWLDAPPEEVSNIVLPAVQNLAQLKAKWQTQRKLREIDLSQWQTEDNKSGYRGVSCRLNGAFEGQFRKGDKRISVGCFSTAEAAARAVALKHTQMEALDKALPTASAVLDSHSIDAGRQCQQLLESQGGVYGCSLPAYHKGLHNTRSSRRSLTILEPKGDEAWQSTNVLGRAACKDRTLDDGQDVDLSQWRTDTNRSGYVGVSCRINGKFEAFSAASGKRVYLGAFQTAQAAARAVALDSLNRQGSREETPHAAGIQSGKTSVRSENVCIPAATALGAMGFSSEVAQAALAAAGNSLGLALDLALASGTDIVPRPVSSHTHKNRHPGKAAVVQHDDDTDMVEGFTIQSSAAAPNNMLHPLPRALCRVLKGCLVPSGVMDQAT